MELQIRELNNIQIAETNPADILIADISDATDLIGNAWFQQAAAVILYEKQLPPQFFDLSTGMAGEMLQKFSNYRMRLAIVRNANTPGSQSLKDFISESNQRGQIIFVESKEKALEALSKLT